MKNELNAKVESLYLAIKKHQLVELSYIDRTGNQTVRKRSLITSCLGIVLGICKVTA